MGCDDDASGVSGELEKSSCVPDSISDRKALCTDLVRRNWLERARGPACWSGSEEYVLEYGSNRRKNVEKNVSTDVPTASSRRKWLVSSLNAIAASVEKKNALNPKAARGNAVAEPR